MSLLVTKKHKVYRPAFTLVEVLSALAILAIVTSLLFAGIQSMRESARRTQCLNRLRQLGVASLNYESSNSVYPNGDWIGQIAPFMELSQVLDEAHRGQLPSEIKSLLCPSDQIVNPSVEVDVFTNYFGNAGTWFRDGQEDGIIADAKFETDGGVLHLSPSHVIDGTANTTIYAEGLRGGLGRLRTVWSAPGKPYSEDEFGVFIKLVRSLPSDPAFEGFLGHHYKGKFLSLEREPRIGVRLGGLTLPKFNHAAGPQQPTVINGSSLARSVCPATSNHSGVVNLVFCDGHTQSVWTGIDLKAWNSLGSRDSNELDSDFF